jgi:hypothetical protein
LRHWMQKKTISGCIQDGDVSPAASAPMCEFRDDSNQLFVNNRACPVPRGPIGSRLLNAVFLRGADSIGSIATRTCSGCRVLILNFRPPRLARPGCESGSDTSSSPSQASEWTVAVPDGSAQTIHEPVLPISSVILLIASWYSFIWASDASRMHSSDLRQNCSTRRRYSSGLLLSPVRSASSRDSRAA